MSYFTYLIYLKISTYISNGCSSGDSPPNSSFLMIIIIMMPTQYWRRCKPSDRIMIVVYQKRQLNCGSIPLLNQLFEPKMEMYHITVHKAFPILVMICKKQRSYTNKNYFFLQIKIVDECTEYNFCCRFSFIKIIGNLNNQIGCPPFPVKFWLLT